MRQFGQNVRRLKNSISEKLYNRCGRFPLYKKSMKNNVHLDTSAMGVSDLGSVALVFDWLSEHVDAADSVEEIAYNQNSGDVYALLSNGCIVSSCFSRPVSFSRFNPITEEEGELTEAEFIAFF